MAARARDKEAGGGAAAATDAAQRKDLILFVNYDRGPGPGGYGFFRIQVPDLSRQVFCDFNHEPTSYVEPFLELPPSYPENLRCIELDSNLYLFGGESVNRVTGQKTYPRDVYLVDTTPTVFRGNKSLRYRHLIKKLPIASRMKSGKEEPYAFVGQGRIYVMENSTPVYYRDSSHYFEVFDPKKGGGIWEILPHPPSPLVVVGDAFVDGKIFLSVESQGGCVLCFDTEKSVWIKEFKTYFAFEDAIFVGNGMVVDDTLYSLSHYNSSLPSAYSNVTPDEVRKTLDQCFANKSRAFHPTSLFGNCAVLSPFSLSHVHVHAYNPWLATHMSHMGNRIFCYVRGGSFPHIERPKYKGLLIFFFRPHPGFVTEKPVKGVPFTRKHFNGDFLTSTHIKFQTASGEAISSLEGCFPVDRPSSGPVYRCASDGLTFQSLKMLSDHHLLERRDRQHRALEDKKQRMLPGPLHLNMWFNKA